MNAADERGAAPLERELLVRHRLKAHPVQRRDPLPLDRRPECRIGLLVRVTPGRHDEPPSDSARGYRTPWPGRPREGPGCPRHAGHAVLGGHPHSRPLAGTPTHAHKNLSLPYANAAAVAGTARATGQRLAPVRAASRSRQVVDRPKSGVSISSTVTARFAEIIGAAGLLGRTKARATEPYVSSARLARPSRPVVRLFIGDRRDGPPGCVRPPRPGRPPV